jgi:endonuclease YncB( thermonuclease family)
MNGKQRLIRFALILIVAGIGYWQRDNLPTAQPDSKTEALREKGTAVLKENPLPSPGGSAATSTKVRGYEKFTDARLVEADGNDGDSFMVQAGGRKFELRLYFVDAPEKYLSDRYEDQRRRVAEQAREMGGITSEEAVRIGKEAKEFTAKQLKGKTFTVFTYWEEVYDGDRFYGFVQLPDGSYLGTRLVEEGLARIHTKGPGSKEKPVPTPEGASFFQHRDKLTALEQVARKAKRGAWRF